MEIIVLIIIYFILKFFINSMKSEDPYQNNYKNAYSEKKFKVSHEFNKINIDGESFKILIPKIKGRLNNRDTKTIGMSVILYDITDGSKKPIISLANEFQDKESQFFHYQSKLTQINYYDAYFEKEVEIVNIPLEFLVFPYSGNRKLKLIVSIFNNKMEIIQQGEKDIQIQINNSGYEEKLEKILKGDQLMIKSAVILSSVDGEFDQAEIDLIRNKIIQKSKDIDGNIDYKKKEKLEKILKESIRFVNSGIDKKTVENLCLDIKENTDISYKYKIIEFLLELAAVDNSYNEKESEFFKYISNNIGININRFNNIKEKIVPISIIDNIESPEKLLGLNEDMTILEKKNHLRKEFQKWNRRVNHKDKKIRQQASDMLDIIADERNKLNKLGN